MFGIVLLFVGFALLFGGISRIYNIDSKSSSLISFMLAFLLIVINILSIINGDYLNAAAGFLFVFNYLFIGLTCAFNLDWRPYGWFSLFIAINTIFFAVMSVINNPVGSIVGYKMMALWILWGILWYFLFHEIIFKKKFEKGMPILFIFEGIVTGWIPGILILINKW